MVHVLPDRPPAVRPYKCYRLAATVSRAWGSTGSVFGPIHFLLYVAHLLQLIRRHQLVPHAYADDTQIYGFCQPCDVDVLSDRMSAACADENAVVDEGQPSDGKSVKNRGPVVLVGPS